LVGRGARWVSDGGWHLQLQDALTVAVVHSCVGKHIAGRGRGVRYLQEKRGSVFGIWQRGRVRCCGWPVRGHRTLTS
jgi:hypothetical protein